MKLFAILVAIVVTGLSTVLIAFGLMAAQHGRFGLLLVALMVLLACGELIIKPLFYLVGKQDALRHIAERNKRE